MPLLDGVDDFGEWMRFVQVLVQVRSSDMIRCCFGPFLHLRLGSDDDDGGGGDSMLLKTVIHFPRVLQAPTLAALRQVRIC